MCVIVCVVCVIVCCVSYSVCAIVCVIVCMGDSDDSFYLVVHFMLLMIVVCVLGIEYMQWMA